MGRDIPGISQMSPLLCGNPTLVESIFQWKKVAHNRQGTGTPAALAQQ